MNMTGGSENTGTDDSDSSGIKACVLFAGKFQSLQATTVIKV